MVDDRRVLVVDDEEDSLEMLSNLIRGMGYNVLAARSSVEALKLLERNSVDLIIADMVMAGINGIELLREMRKRGIGAKFIMVTAYGEMESYIEVMNLGAVEYLSKPINHDHLVQVIGKTIGPVKAARR